MATMIWPAETELGPQGFPKIAIAWVHEIPVQHNIRPLNQTHFSSHLIGQEMTIGHFHLYAHASRLHFSCSRSTIAEFAHFEHTFGNIPHRRLHARQFGEGPVNRVSRIRWRGWVRMVGSYDQARSTRCDAGCMEAEWQHCDEQMLSRTPRKDFG